MRQRSDTWKRIAARGNFRVESVAIIGGVEYTAISAPDINRALLSDNLSVGNCISATLKVYVLTDDEIAKSAKAVIKSRITDDVEYSEWLEFGTFYIDNRTVNSGLVTLLCYDSMLKANQQYGDETNPEDRIGWPKTMQTCVEEIAARIGVEIDPRTVIRTADPYQVPYPAKLTMIQVLGYIGACHGGNWVITAENKLRLVPLLSPPAETFNIIDHDYNQIYTGDGHRLVWKHTDTGETVEHKAGGGLLNVPVVIGKIETSKTRIITRVTLARDEELGYTLGNDTGYELRIESNPYACQAICDDLYAEINGLEYVPYTAQGACYDPAVELGDWILTGDKVRSVLYSENAKFDVDFRSTISAPGKDEASSEYPYLTAIERLKKKDEQLEKYLEESKTIINSKIEQTHTSILLEVAGVYANKDEVSADLNILAEEIVAEVERATAADEQMASKITVNANAITSEVTRAKNKETELQSSITQTAEKVELKVSKGDISSQISVESGKVTIGSNRLTIDSTNFKLSGTGTVTASGTLSSKSGDNVASLSSGMLTFSNDGTELLAVEVISDGTYASLYVNGIGGFNIWTNDGYSWDDRCFEINNGIANDDDSEFYSEKNIFYNGVHCTDGDLTVDGHLYFDTPYYHNGEVLDLYMSRLSGTTSSFGLVVDGAFLCTTGDFWCDGQKNRVVQTENYGRVGLSAMESAVALFSDIGSGTIDDTGVTYIYIDPVFAETIDNVHEYQVFVSATDCAALTKVEKHTDFFVVHGIPGATFDWILFARQKDYVTYRLESLPVVKEDNIRVNNAVFYGDNTAAAQAESYMGEFADTYDEQAEAYLNQYEQEVTNYGN